MCRRRAPSSRRQKGQSANLISIQSTAVPLTFSKPQSDENGTAPSFAKAILDRFLQRLFEDHFINDQNIKTIV